MRRIKITLAGLALLVATLVSANPAQAITVYCNQHVAPVSLSLARTGMYTVKATTSAPINSTAQFYARPGTGGTWVLVDTAHQAAGSNLSYTIGTSSSVEVGIHNIGDTGQVWTDSGGNPISPCYSPLREVS